ncbi:protein broad-minded-like [Periplaneta americana]|uniref:protein broad-minded-like n=1 Tax=Periplaneta americana TaxID=6978 RepID=UPI0037E82790
MQHEGSSNFRADLTRMVQNSIKEKLEDVVNSELENVGEITPQTWKIVAHNVTKSVKDSPAMYSLLEGVQSMLFSTIENVISNIENEPISEFHNTQSLIQRSVNDGWYQGHTNMRLYEQLAVDTAQQRPLKVRKQALTVLHQSVLNEVMSTNYWPQIRLHLRENLCEENDEVFNISIKIHAKLLQSSSHVCIKEGFINLVEGMQMYYSKIYQNSLPNFKTGIDFNVLIHQHLCQIMYLILEATKEMPKNWLRYGERRVEQIVTAFVTLLAMHTDESRLDLPRDILYPFHIIAILDPRAGWCVHWLHGAFGQNLFLNAVSQNLTLMSFLVEEILLSLEEFQNYHPENITQNLAGNSVKYATYIHTLTVLSNILCYEKGKNFFPIIIQSVEKSISLEYFIVKIVRILNLENNYVSEVSTPSRTETVMELIKKLLKNADESICESLVKAVIEPLEPENNQSNECINMPYHSVKILLLLLESNIGSSCLLGSRQKRKIYFPRVNRSQNSTNTSAVGLKRNRNMSISFDRQFSARSIRIPSRNDSDNSNSVKVIENVTTAMLRDLDMSRTNTVLSMVEMCAKLFSLHEGLPMMDPLNSQLLQTIITLYKQLSSMRESIKYYSFFSHSSKAKDYNSQSDQLCASLASFLAAVASTPCGLFALAQDDEILQDLLSLLLQSSFVPWENPEFRRIMSLTTILPQAVPVLTEESHRILARALCNIWCEYESPVALMTGSDRKQNESIQHFINIIFTFALSLQGIMALLTESETSSEITLVDAEPHPTTLSELLIFDSSAEPSHYVALLTLRVLTTNMDVCLHLNASTKFQEKLLKLQSENITSDAEPIEAEELRSRSSSSNEPIIIDQCSILRHQILVATYAIGGPTERILPQVVFDKEHEDNIPTLFCSLPPPSLASLRSTARQRRSTRLKGQTDFQRFLQDTKQGLHDANWLSHARRAYKTSRNEEVKAFVLLELIDQVTKLNSNAETLSDLQLESEDNELFPEEKLGIQAVIRYGITCHLLQENQQNEDNLAQLLYMSHSLTKHRKSETFQGFDWFVGTVFLLCGGNMERCRSCLGNVAALPVGPFLWPALAAAQDKASNNLSHRSTMFGHILELLVKVELPLAFSALQISGASWWLICQQWMAQCFWNILDWSQICHWLVITVLNQPDFTIYFCVSLLRHMQPQILQAASEGKLWEFVMLCPMEGFQVGDQLSFMEKLAKRYRASVLDYLLA